ncbi:MAG: hypothetical protein JO314_10555 [Acidobacteria bacterium]|nr:hypothetical protein [Acidobacteriota bacterium]
MSRKATREALQAFRRWRALAEAEATHLETTFGLIADDRINKWRYRSAD